VHCYAIVITYTWVVSILHFVYSNKMGNILYYFSCYSILLQICRSTGKTATSFFPLFTFIWLFVKSISKESISGSGFLWISSLLTQNFGYNLAFCVLMWLTVINFGIVLCILLISVASTYFIHILKILFCLSLSLCLFVFYLFIYFWLQEKANWVRFS
jgi:hypothetical protein